MGKRNRRKGAANAQPSQELDSHKSEKYTSKAIKNWNDVEHDDIDKFHDTRNKISFDDNDNDSDDIEDEEILGVEYPQEEDEDEEEEEEEEEEDTMEDWGTKKSNYYDGDEVEDEEDARLEEEEAIRIQKMRVNTMNEQDFMAPNYGQLTGKDLIKDELEDHKLVLDLDKELKNIDLTQPIKSINKGNGYTKDEAIEMLEKDSPELFGLLEQLKEKWEMVKDESSEVATKIKELSPEVVKATPLLQHFYLKYETTLNYLTNISFYLYLKSVGTPNLQDHPIIDVLIKHANIIKNLEDAEEGSDDLLEMVKEAIIVIENGGVVGDEELGENSNEDLSLEEGDEEEESQDEEALEDEEEEAMESEPESSDVEALPEQTLAELRRSLKTSGSKRMAKESDFQDTEYLDEADAAEKMIKKKSLRHYASVINQKRAKLPKFTGDIDIPYKSKDEKYKQPVNQAINNQSNDADIFDDEENEVAPSIEETKKERKNTKRVKVLDPEEMERRTEAWKAMNPDEQEVEGSSKRIASYKILKNKGLTPKRKKEQRNPRVKHRKKFEKASKKLSSFKRVVQDSKTSYGGEATGIKTHLSRSVRFQ